MVLRGFCYVVFGWMLIAVVGGLAEVFSITVMLPATSAVIVTHVAFSRTRSVPYGLAIAIALGYLEDLHQGAPVGTLTLAHALTALVLYWASGRVAVRGIAMRAAAAAIAVVLVDAFTFAILLSLAEPLAVGRSAVIAAASTIHWHVLATALVAPPVWVGFDRAFELLRLDDEPPQKVYWTGR
jgi:cell shape-determining protein MreD